MELFMVTVFSGQTADTIPFKVVFRQFADAVEAARTDAGMTHDLDTWTQDEQTDEGIWVFHIGPDGEEDEYIIAKVQVA